MVYRSIDKLDKIGRDGVLADLTRNGVTEDAANEVLDIVTTKGTSDELLAFAHERLQVFPAGVKAVDELASLVGCIEELGVPKGAYKIDLALARGIDYYTGPVYEATVEEPKVGSVADVLMVFIPDTLADSAAIARELRSHGVRVDQSVVTNKGIGDQLKYADRRGIPFAIIAGPDELARDEVSVKNLRTGEQRHIGRAVLVQELKILLNP